MILKTLIPAFALAVLLGFGPLVPSAASAAPQTMQLQQIPAEQVAAKKAKKKKVAQKPKSGATKKASAPKKSAHA